jgi:pyruvate kinase
VTSPSPLTLHQLHDRVRELATGLDEEAEVRRHAIDAALPQHRASALNLAHYLGLRRQDVRGLQMDLAAVGLSSLGRCEGHVHDTVDWLCAWLSGTALSPGAKRASQGYPDAAEAERLLHANARALFGPRPRDRHVYIMVTAPEAAEASDAWADSLIDAGANLLRINAAHGSPADWQRITSTFRAGAAARGIPARIVIDLPGPKLRAEIREFEAGVIRVKRCKDALGRTLKPTEVQLVANCTGPNQIPVPAAWLPRLRVGDTLVLTDPRNRKVALTVRARRRRAVIAEGLRSLFVVAGLALSWRRGATRLGKGAVGDVPQVPRRILGDRFVLNASGAGDARGTVTLAVPEPHLLAAVHAGDRVVLDDGRVVAVTERQRGDGLLCRVTATVKPSMRLQGGKGIAFPDSELAIDSLGAADETALGFALAHADAVGASFISSAADVRRVGERIRASGKPAFGMIVKLETRSAMHNLPAILFEALKYERVGLMIARGDLAIDLGFERLAEMQEELLWFGEACHLPVVWATQVLESVAHSGLPTRAEVTDAAMSMRAECVMLNKGPYVATANRLLADIIRKMEAHQYKKRALLRPLSVAGAMRRTRSKHNNAIP